MPHKPLLLLRSGVARLGQSGRVRQNPLGRYDRRGAGWRLSG